MGRICREAVYSIANTGLALLVRKTFGSITIPSEGGSSLLTDFLVEGSRVGGVVVSILLGWRVYQSATTRAVTQERSAQDRLQSEFDKFRLRTKEDIRDLREQVDLATESEERCRQELAEIRKRLNMIQEKQPNE